MINTGIYQELRGFICKHTILRENTQLIAADKKFRSEGNINSHPLHLFPLNLLMDIDKHSTTNLPACRLESSLVKRIRRNRKSDNQLSANRIVEACYVEVLKAVTFYWENRLWRQPISSVFNACLKDGRKGRRNATTTW